MKKTIRYLLLAGGFFIAQKNQAQSDISGVGVGHAGLAGYYVGWNAATALPLTVQHLGNQQIRFSTNGFQRMLISNGGSGSPDGRVAMGQNLPAGFAPQARLHLIQYEGTVNGDMFRSDGPNTVDNNWRMYTGATQATATEKFQLFVPSGTNHVYMQTTQNGRMYFRTNAIQRMTLGHLAFGAFMDSTGHPNPVPGNNLTRVMIHRDGSAPITRPLSLLHLGYSFPNLAQGGQRNWMDVGMMCMAGTDHVYVGLRQQGATATGFPSTVLDVPNDHQDAVLAWGDNDNSNPAIGPDNMCFVYTAPPAFGTGRANSNDGLEVMRMIYNGNIGIGPIFNNSQQPQSNVHMLTEGPATNWHQIANQNTGVLATDGLRTGVIGNGNANVNGHALIYNQELRPLLFSTNANTNTVNTNLPLMGTTQERLRIQSAGTPVFTFGVPFGTWGVSNPAGVAANITRVSVSHNPAQPLWRPLSLMHIGYSAAVNTAATVMDGWRPWMDIGTYTASNSDNMYSGLKLEATNHYDAVIAWGRNQDSITQPSPEKLRFIFNTNYNATPDNNPANDINGLEVGRFYAGKDTLGKYGRFGVGDFTSAGLNQEPTHALDVWGNGRFRLLPDNIYKADAAVTKVMMVDEDGVLRWDDAVQSDFGWSCTDTAAVGLTDSRKIPMNDFNIHFDDNGSLVNGNNIGIGTNCTDVLTAKLVVDNIAMNSGLDVLTTKSTANNYGIRVVAQNATATSTGIEGRAPVAGPNFNKGVRGFARNAVQTNMGGDFLADSPSSNNYGVNATATSATTGNYGIIANGSNGTDAYGVHATASGGSTFSYGVYCSAPTSASNAAIYINGDIRGTGTDFYTSDVNLKQNIQTLENASEILSQLKPKTYEFDHSVHPAMNLPNGPQMGLIAQDVQTVLPHLVKQSIFPAQYDTTGTMTSPAYNYLSMSYTGLIPVLIGGHNEQRDEINNLKAENQELKDRLAALEQCVSSLNLCNPTVNPAMLPSNNGTSNDANHVKNVELTNAKSIVLDQNVPNPFAEQTTITYELTDDVQRAQMLFYNADGKLINSVELTERGKGQLNVFANDLSNGIYAYTLVVDGQIKDTKRMVKNK